MTESTACRTRPSGCARAHFGDSCVSLSVSHDLLSLDKTSYVNVPVLTQKSPVVIASSRTISGARVASRRTAASPRVRDCAARPLSWRHWRRRWRRTRRLWARPPIVHDQPRKRNVRGILCAPCKPRARQLGDNVRVCTCEVVDLRGAVAHVIELGHAEWPWEDPARCWAPRPKAPRWARDCMPSSPRQRGPTC